MYTFVKNIILFYLIFNFSIAQDDFSDEATLQVQLRWLQ